VKVRDWSVVGEKYRNRRRCFGSAFGMSCVMAGVVLKVSTCFKSVLTLARRREGRDCVVQARPAFLGFAVLAIDRGWQRIEPQVRQRSSSVSDERSGRT
jgi:hypothetical protein